MMKNKRNLPFVLNWMLCSSFFLLQSCFSTQSRVITQNDYSNSSKRIEFNYFQTNLDWSNPLLYQRRYVVKEIKPENEINIMFYDVLALKYDSYKLSDQIFIAIDDKSYPIFPELVEYDLEKSINTTTEDIIKSDSTTETVITGFSEHLAKVTRFGYSLPNSIIKELIVAEKVIFQYYAGPRLLTIKVKKRHLRKIKKIFRTN